MNPKTYTCSLYDPEEDGGFITLKPSMAVDDGLILRVDDIDGQSAGLVITPKDAHLIGMELLNWATEKI